ncbi:MAG: hybrid sensor histidine kinase/response regulator [Bacteroidales bacterium]|nr:hybrid sensor histidine kinase/response regulator [Bacteroidales bacterium]
MKNTNRKILIVDDIPANIQILGNILSTQNFQIAYAQSGKQALSVIKHQKLDLILLDIMMPSMDGFEVCQILKSQKETAEIPIIFLTAKADMDSIVKGFEVGGQDYITKPFNSAELLARVNTHILIYEQRKKLKELNENLEGIVKERTQELESAYNRLDHLEKAKTDFLSIISHELRTPLNGLTGLSTLLSQTELSSEQREYIQYLKEVSGRLAKFSEIALLITSLQVQKYEADLIPTAVKYLMESAAEKFEKNTGQKLRLTNVDKDVMIPAAPDLIKKSLEFVLDNAKNHNNNGEIELIANAVKESVEILCHDNGSGFDQEALDHPFELFYNGDFAHVQGTGLSLVAVKLIMDLHGGDIKIENRKNGGASVRLKFKRL